MVFSTLSPFFRLVTMVNFSVTATDSYPKNTRFASAKPSQGVEGAFLDYEMDITLTLDFTLILNFTSH